MSFLTNTELSTEEVAKKLLGCLLVSEEAGLVTSGWIVETEAYVGTLDEACHSYGGRNTPRLKSMYSDAGTIYIYQMHTHYMLNIITKEAGNPQGVLIRAVEPHQGSGVMEERRGKKGIEVTNGPGKLTKALGITKKEYGTSIYEPPLYIDTTRKKVPSVIEKSKRIGIPNKGEWTNALLRYTVKGNPYISRNKGKVSVDYGWDAVLD